ncbi:hypothetical protein IAQ61_009157 [Plenodomus lingam]|nr:hypothetical protein IAQ61_009157 [Plenodomus lingam]
MCPNQENRIEDPYAYMSSDRTKEYGKYPIAISFRAGACLAPSELVAPTNRSKVPSISIVSESCVA